MKFLLVFHLMVVIFANGYGLPHKASHRDSLDQEMSASNMNDDDSDMYMEPLEQKTVETRVLPEDPEGGGQTFFPAFSPFQPPPLGHSRPFYFQQEGAYSQRPSSFHQQLGFETPRFAGYKGDSFTAQQTKNAASDTHGMLGSGNFGVIKGGTFYHENDNENAKFSSNHYNSYLHNGHGRPSYYFGSSNPRPQQEEQFANFRDFADINTPANPAYSQYVVVYVNKNGTRQDVIAKKPHYEPKNIIERLAMLDLESSTTTTTTELAPTKKLSKSKRKLAALLPEKKLRNKKFSKEGGSKDLREPLLALS